ncbi:MAG: hypothetical protein FWD23_03665 [Oscillospiraceae bacterium]|nr:hypothetical protein [Oscillospiraceae bacterium]
MKNNSESISCPGPHKTDWFHNKKWGVFNHLLGGNDPKWSDYINSLDVDLIADQIAEINAGYLFLTVMQGGRTMLAPNVTYNKITGYKSGEACAERDFIEDIYQALNKRGIDLLLYYTGDGPYKDAQANKKFGCPYMDPQTGAPVTPLEFVRKWADVLREYSVRYGPKVKGWWIDGCYKKELGYDEPRLDLLAGAIRSGNPDALVAFNDGCKPRVSAYSANDDFTAGEMPDFSDLPDMRFIGDAQWHILSYLGIPPDGVPWNGWSKPGCKYTGEYMFNYITKVHGRGGVVTIDFYMSREGVIDKNQMTALRALKDLN